MRILGDVRELLAQSLVDQFVERLAEHVGVPDLLGALAKRRRDRLDQLLRLRFAADDGVDLGFDVRFDHVDGLRCRAQTHAVAARLLDDLRLLERQLLDRRHHDAVALALDLVQRHRHAVIVCLCLRQRAERVEQLRVIFDVHARQLGEHGEILFARHRELHDRFARAEVGLHILKEGADRLAHAHGKGAADLPHLFQFLSRRQRAAVDVFA